MKHLQRAFLEISTACDSKCRLCDYWRDKHPTRLSPDAVAKNIVPLLADMGINRVSITGGEPTLHPNLPEIAASIHAEGIAITLITSTSNLASVYNQIDAYVDTYMFSLDGANRSQYIKTRGIDLFDQVVAWPAEVKKRSRCQSQVVFSCVIQRANAFDLENIYNISCKSGADGISFRVPDTTSHAFGRNGVVPRPTMAAINFDPEELDSIGRQLERILSRDEEIHHLNQDRAFLMSIEARLRVMTGKAPQKNNARCWAPQSSVVITADQKLKPCFFLPASFPVHSDSTQEPRIRLSELSDRMASEDHPYSAHCSRCSQFEEWKIPDQASSQR